MTEQNEQQKEIKIRIKVDTSELDEAISKTKELVSCLNRAEELIQLLAKTD